MKTLLRYNLICLVAVLVTGCGGGSSSSSNPVERTIRSAPIQADFFDTDGTLVSRIQFQYPDELTINAQLHSIGADMLWDTEDDTSHMYLQCLYMSAPTPLLRYPDLYFLGMAPSPLGITALAQLGLPYDGQMIKCPVRSGRRLLQESGYVSSLFMPSLGDSFSYLINAELENFGGTATEVIDYEFIGLDRTVAEAKELIEYEWPGEDSSVVPEPDLPIVVDHTQTTTVLYDVNQRPLSIDLIADSPWTALLDEYCVDGETIDIHLMLLRDCSSAHKTLFYRYLGDSVEQDVQRYNGSNLAGISTSTATRLASSVIVHSGTVDDGPTSGSGYQSYPFNEAEQVTATVSSSYDFDATWGTEDDLHFVFNTYHYDDNGRLSEVRYAGRKQQAYDYYQNGNLKQVDVFDSQSDVPARRKQISYRHGSPAQITVQYRVEDPDDGYVLKTRIVIKFAPSEETWAELFAPIALPPEMLPPSIDDLMRFQPHR